MKILVNAVSIKEGGPLVVFRNLLRGMHALAPYHTWLIAGPSLCGAMTVLDAPVTGGNPFPIARWYELGLPRAVKKLKPDIVFSLTNYLPFRNLDCPAVLLEQHAGHFSPEFQALDRAFFGSPSARLKWRLSNVWVRQSVRRAEALLVQTGALADRIAWEGLRRRDAIDVVAHGPGQVCHAPAPRRRRTSGPWRIGYPAKFGVQKNFSTLFCAAKRLGETRDIRIVLTLNPSYEPAKRVLREAEDLGIMHLIDNMNELAPGAMEGFYDALDIVAFCSLCESFGVPLAEAMARGLPVIAADTPENREITAGAAPLFPPHDDAALASELDRLMSGDSYAVLAEKSLARGRDFSWVKASEGTLAVIERTARQRDDIAPS